MAKIAMDPDQVRAMANTATRTAESMQGHMSQIVSSVRGAEWQSQAREEFIERLETLSRVNTQSISALRLMANAANQKAHQWETKASRFGSTIESTGSLWSSFMDNLNNSWQGLLESIRKIGIGGISIVVGGIGAIGGWIGKIEFPWERNETPAPSSPTPAPAPAQPAPAPEAPPAQPPAPERHYPYPPNQITLKEGKDIRSCAYYARSRRPDLEACTGFGPHGPNGMGAANYAHKFADKAFQIGEGERGNLKDVIGVGYAITWEPGYKSHAESGHVAIIEEVYSDHVVISEATIKNGSYVYNTRPVYFDELANENVTLIP